MQHLKVVAVGDGAVGKTSMLIAYTLKAFPTDYVPTVFDNYNAVVDWDNRKVNIGLWDTAGQDDFQSMRPLCYENADVFLLMFSVGSEDSFHNVRAKWLSEVNRAKRDPSTPVILVGTKVDLRSDEAYLRSIAPAEPVTFSEGKKLATEIGAISYLECSSVRGMGFEDIFAQCIAAIINMRMLHKDISKFCYHTTCEIKISALKRKKCVRCQHFFCQEHVETLPKDHDYHGKNMCLHCLAIDRREPLQRRQKQSILSAVKNAKKSRKKSVPEPVKEDTLETKKAEEPEEEEEVEVEDVEREEKDHDEVEKKKKKKKSKSKPNLDDDLGEESKTKKKRKNKKDNEPEDDNEDA